MFIGKIIVSLFLAGGVVGSGYCIDMQKVLVKNTSSNQNTEKQSTILSEKKVQKINDKIKAKEQEKTNLFVKFKKQFAIKDEITVEKIENSIKTLKEEIKAIETKTTKINLKIYESQKQLKEELKKSNTTSSWNKTLQKQSISINEIYKYIIGVKLKAKKTYRQYAEDALNLQNSLKNAIEELEL